MRKPIRPARQLDEFAANQFATANCARGHFRQKYVSPAGRDGCAAGGACENRSVQRGSLTNLRPISLRQRIAPEVTFGKSTSRLPGVTCAQRAVHAKTDPSSAAA